MRPRRTRRASCSRTPSNRLGFGAKRTMQIAQGLYEGVDLGKDARPGRSHHVHAYRLDAPVARRGERGARATSRASTARSTCPPQPNVFKSKKNAQDAHEAIRPTSLELPPESVRKHLKDEQFKLYKLIWERFVASPDDARGLRPDERRHRGEAGERRCDLRPARERTHPEVQRLARGLRQGRAGEVGAARRRGRRRQGRGGANGDGDANGAAAPRRGRGKDLLAEDAEAHRSRSSPRAQALHLVTPPGVLTEQKFTQPPPRYNEARSCASSRSAASAARARTPRSSARCRRATTSRRSRAGASARRRSASSSSTGWCRASSISWTPRSPRRWRRSSTRSRRARRSASTCSSASTSGSARSSITSKKGKRWNPEPEPTSEKCELDGGVMLKRWSRNGWFLGCANYPECKSTRDLGADGNRATVPRETGIACDKCGKPMVIRSGRFGEFLSCTGYPECKNAKPVPLGVPCPKCGGDIIEIRSKKRGGQDLLRLLELRERSGEVRLQAVAEADRASRAPTAPRRSSSWAARGPSR